MNFETLLPFAGKNLMFSFVIMLVSFILGWVLYNGLVLKKISLRDALFEKDNPAAWVEFIGAFVFPTLYLAAKAIEGPASDNIFVDLAVCLVYAAVYVLILTVLRLLSGTFVSYIAIKDEQGKVSLNNEIYGQHNTAAAMFSTALSIAFAGMIRFLDIVPEYLLVSVLKISVVLVFSLLAFVAYILFLKSRSSLFKEIFIDNNVAAGIAYAGYIFAVQIILGNAVALQSPFDLTELVVMSLVSLVLFLVLTAFFKKLFCKIISVDIWTEVYEHNNLGAALGIVALYVGVANILIHFLR